VKWCHYELTNYAYTVYAVRFKCFPMCYSTHTQQNINLSLSVLTPPPHTHTHHPELRVSHTENARLRPKMRRFVMEVLASNHAASLHFMKTGYETRQYRILSPPVRKSNAEINSITFMGVFTFYWACRRNRLLAGPARHTLLITTCSIKHLIHTKVCEICLS